MELVGCVGRLGSGQPADQGAELVLPALSDGILHYRSMVAEVVGDLHRTGEFDLLVAAVRRERHTSQLVADERHAAIL